ncbi:MAG: DNA polymerase III subunit delta', partial [Desulfobacterales bacterium]|nr:DNA polymerase III subunit delta' [Desulfobacterales bacterium]
IPNALLFTGPSGTGKTEAAFVFAMGVNCRDESQTVPCQHCSSCKKIAARMHPDMIQVTPEEKKKNITISQIREMGMRVTSLPNEARHRMIMIQQADLMNVQAQNALLKLLEEPPENTFFILLAQDLSGLLDTILSRCRKIRFKPITGQALVDHLVGNLNVPAQRAAIVAATAGSDLAQARRLADVPQGEEPSKNWEARRHWLITQMLNLMNGKSRNPQRDALSLSQRLSREPDTVADAVAVIRSMFRDLCVLPHDAKKIVNLDFFDAFKDISPMVKYHQLLKWTDDLYETEKRLMSNSSLRLTLDRFFLGLCLD